MKRNSVDETLEFLSAKLHNLVFRSLTVVVPLRYGRDHNHKTKLIFQPLENPFETLHTELKCYGLYFTDLSDLPPANLNITECWGDGKLHKAGDPSELGDLLALAQLAGVVGRAGGRGSPFRPQAGIVHTDGHQVRTARDPSSA